MKKYWIAVLLGLLPTMSFASEDASIDVGVHLSTLGYGLSIAHPLTDTISGRLGFNQFSKSFDQTSDSINYAGDLKLSSFDILADWHPFDGVTHLTAGLMYNNNKLEMMAQPSGPTITINGNTYNSADVGTMTAAVEFNKAAPYLGFGWSGQAKNTGFSFKSDFGVLFQGKPKSTITCSNPVANPVIAADCVAEQAKLDDDLKNFKYYPVISIGIGYAF